MNYYKQGDAAKADQIKAAFEKLGIDVLDFGFADKTMVYCSIGGACVQTLPYSINLMHILYSNPDYKELELPIEPCFKVGDKIEATIYGIKRRVTIRAVDKTNRCYFGTLAECIGFSEQDQWHLAPKPHYDIANFQPFDKVLVRDRNDESWRIAFYGYYNEEAHYSHFVGTCWSKQCIPFNDDTKHLLGTTDMPSEEYINW